MSQVAGTFQDKIRTFAAKAKTHPNTPYTMYNTEPRLAALFPLHFPITPPSMAAELTSE